MWTRGLLKDNAKNALNGRYWPCFAVTLICGLLGAGPSLRMALNLSTYSHSYRHAFRVTLPLWGNWGVVGLLVAVFFAAVLAVGQARFFMENRQGFAPVSSLFSAFHRDGYWNLVKIQFLKKLYIFLWSLLFIIPGIVKAYQYSMVDYIAAENPYLPADRVFALSRAMTDGEKGALFLLDLSFIGWYLLGALALGVGMLFVLPYHAATWAEAYAALRAKAFAQGVTGEEELSGFVRY